MLILERGYAEGGAAGIDTYRILQNSTDFDAYISLSESLTQEDSHVLLSHRVNQIQEIRLVWSDKNKKRSDEVWNDKSKDRLDHFYDIEMTLLNDNGSRTFLTLKNIYHDVTKKEDINQEKGREIKLQSSYLFSTYDGFTLIPDWFQGVSVDVNFKNFSPYFSVQYNPLFDLRPKSQEIFKNRISGVADIIDLKRDNGQGRSEITIGESTVVLPECMSLILEDTPYEDILKGSQGKDAFHLRRGNDIAQGKGGSDVYYIHDDQAHQAERIVWIDNEDSKKDQDLVVLEVSFDKIKIKADGHDVNISYQMPGSGKTQIIIKDFMKDARYRHIKVKDVMGNYQRLGVDKKGQLSCELQEFGKKHELNYLIEARSAFLESSVKSQESNAKTLTESSISHLNFPLSQPLFNTN